MFAVPSPQNVRRARPQVGQLTALAIPAAGINARDSLSLMGPQHAISLSNVLCESYGLRTRKGYTEWARNLPTGAVATMMSYYPATVAPATVKKAMRARGMPLRMLAERPALRTAPVGKLFAARNGQVFDVTAGGVGAWVPETGVGVVGGSDYWTWINFQNIAGAFLLACNNEGGYVIYNGTTWTAPTMGAAAGQIDGIDPAKFCFVMEHKKRLWFIEKDSTKAWYLPVSQITGAATVFDFGEQFKHGGHLASLSRYTVDGGEGVDDYLIAVGSQGDIAIYKGIDPDDATQWQIHGVWYVGSLPVGRRAVLNTGIEVYVLSQLGVTPISLLLAAPQQGVLEQKRTTYLIAPLIARLLREYSAYEGWALWVIPKEELFVIGIPREVAAYGGQFFALKVSSGGWSLVKDVPYASFVNVDADAWAGTLDGRVVRAFDGPLDNVLIDSTSGKAIECNVTPSYQMMGANGSQMVFKLVRPTFVTTITPTLSLRIMTDYGPPKPPVVPTLPDITESRWDEDLWNVGRWSGVQDPIKKWLGCHGIGFAGTVQLVYKCGGDTVLAAIDFWTERGGVL